MAPEELIKSLPADVQEVLNEGLAERNEQRRSLIQVILNNKRNTFTEAALHAMKTTDLRSLAQLAGSDVPRQTPSYVGANGAPPVGNAAPSTQKPLTSPKYEFDDPIANAKQRKARV